MESSGAPERLLAHIASISIAIDRSCLETYSTGPDVTDSVLVPLLKRLQNGVIQLEREDGRTLPSEIREAFVDLYPLLFGLACSGCTAARVTYLACLQALVKMNPKAFHGDWPRLLGGESLSSSTSSSLPVPNGSSASYNCGLYAHLRDEAPKLRHAVAASISTLIEGPAQRAYLGMATHRGGLVDKVKSFISLSEVLGRLVAVNVEALRRAVAVEEDEAACAAMVRAMTAFLIGSWSDKKTFSGTGRMPWEIAWRCVAVLVQKVDDRDICTWQQTGSTGPDTFTTVSTTSTFETSRCTFSPPSSSRTGPSSGTTTSSEVVVVCLGSLASIFGAGTVPHDQHDEPEEPNMGVDVAIDVLVRCLAREKSTRIKLEAATALRALLRAAVRAAGSPSSGKPTCLDHSMFVKHIENRQEERERQLMSLFMETKAALSRAKPTNASHRKENSNKERLLQQLILLFGDLGMVDRDLVVAAANHPAARIRAAAFSCFSGAKIQESEREAYLSLAEKHAVEISEKESTVRSSAVKAYLEALTRESHFPAQRSTPDLDTTTMGETHGVDDVADRIITNPNCHIVPVVSLCLQDTVLAVRINAAILAAEMASILWQSCMENLADTWGSAEKRQRGVLILTKLLECTIAACRDHEKVAVHGFRALGFLTGGILRLEGTSTQSLSDNLSDEIISVLMDGMARGANGKKELQWSCSEAIAVVCMLRLDSSENASDAFCARLTSIVDITK